MTVDTLKNNWILPIKKNTDRFTNRWAVYVPKLTIEFDLTWFSYVWIFLSIFVFFCISAHFSSRRKHTSHVLCRVIVIYLWVLFFFLSSLQKKFESKLNFFHVNAREHCKMMIQLKKVISLPDWQFLVVCTTDPFRLNR